jgi:predicted ATP-dependent serine protease
LRVRAISAVLTETPAEPNWLVRGLIVGGTVTLISGLPKAGKSSLVMGMVAKIAHGEDFIGLPTSKARTLILSEESALAFREKAIRFGLDDDGAAVVFWSDVHAEPWGDILQQAAEYAQAHDFDLLVIDTWNRWSGLSGDSENHAGAVLTSLAPVNIAAAEGLAVVLVTHARKTPGEFGADVRGSNALVGSVDIAIKYEPPSIGMRAGPTTRLLRAWSRFAATPTELLLNLDESGFHPLAIEERSERDRATILATLAETEEPLSVDEISNRTGIEPQTVRRRLGECTQQIVTHGAGRKGDPKTYEPVRPTPLREAA